MTINIYNETNEKIDKYKNILVDLFDQQTNEKSIEVIFVTPKQITKYNNDFRKINTPTDVLSFPNNHELDTSLGDVLINLEQARLQANSYNHSDIREIAFLAVHGYLHLLGYDHNTKEAETIMFNKQEEILNKAGIERMQRND